MTVSSAPWLRSATRAHWRSRRVIIWASILFVTAGVLAFIPLLDRLGFGFAFVMALVGSAAGIDLGAAFVRRARQWPTPELAVPHRVLATLGIRAGVVNLILLAPPLALICANGLRVRTCDWLFGVQVFVLMPVFSTLAATALGVLVALAWRPRSNRGHCLAGAVPVLVVLGALGYEVWRFYAAPPVFSYSLFAGYFPGNLYDEQLALTEPFYWARLAQTWALIAAWAAASYLLDVPRLRLRGRRRPRGPRWRSAALAVMLGGGAGALYGNASALGFAVDTDDIKHHLGGRYDTEHFTIYFPLGGDIERDIHAIADDHEFRYAQVVRALGAAPERRITSFYFGSAEDKFRLMGARNVYMAKPWRNEIYVHHRRFPHQVLRHEIVHAVAAVFGSPIFRVSAADMLGLPVVFNVGLIEGIAVAADWPDHFTKALTPHQSVKAMRVLGLAPPVEQVFSTGFLAVSSARSYTLAGSFVRFLLDTYGIAPLQQVYRQGGNFAQAYGKPRGELVREWEAMIESIELPAGAAQVVRERFRRPGIFSRPCPHAIARARARAGERLARSDWDEAIALLRQVCSQAPHEPRYRRELAGLLRGNGDSAGARDIYRSIVDNADEMSSTLRGESLLDLAAMAARAGDWPEVVALLDQAAALPVPEHLGRNIVAQRFVATHTGPAGPLLRAYFWDYDPRHGPDTAILLGRAAQVVAAEPNLGLGHYLLGRNLHSRGVPAEVARALSRALDAGLPHPLITRETARLLASAAYLAADRERLARAVDIMLAPGQPAVTRLYGADWRERMHWKQTGDLLAQEPGQPSP